MIGPKQLIIALLWGGLLILIGLVPGLFQNLVEGVHRYRDFLLGSFEGSMRREPDDVQQPAWLMVLGSAIILIALAAYITD
jgi:hypothetical protein